MVIGYKLFCVADTALLKLSTKLIRQKLLNLFDPFVLEDMSLL